MESALMGATLGCAVCRAAASCIAEVMDVRITSALVPDGLCRWLNRWGDIEQAYGLSPVCVRSCGRTAPLSLCGTHRASVGLLARVGPLVLG